jgi:uncharacterized protein
MGLEPPRYVFDTSAVVSALLFEQSVPGHAFSAALDRGEILLSHATAAELAEVLSRKKFDRYLTREERDQFLVMLLRQATLVEIGEEVRACRDPKDDVFLELAVSQRPTPEGRGLRTCTGQPLPVAVPVPQGVDH